MNTENKAVWGIHTQDDYLFLHQNVIAIGWKEMGDMSTLEHTREAVKEKYRFFSFGDSMCIL